ncbi:MAG: hypothetical protein K7J47_17550, partial [Acidobacteria bacterium]|nr:hypothetical protein [Bryobacteraceae bacterium CoA2 C42]
PSIGDRNKFGTYHRDQTGLDYADQRYYNSAIGRFLSADPYEASGGANEPASWGRGVYVHGDPVNFSDPTGEILVNVEGGSPGGVFSIPGLIFSVWKLIFRGMPKDPVAEAWRTNPSAPVAAWDRKIAAAREDGEQQDKRYIAALKIVGDCYTKSAFGGTWIRRFTYQPVDQEGNPFARGEYSVTEQNVVVQGGSLIGQATWGPQRQNPNGTFTDYVGKLNPRSDDLVMYQTFTATMLNSAGFAPGIGRPVMVTYPGYGAENFGTLGHWMTNGGVRTNNYWYNPNKEREICPDEPVMRWQ